MATSDNILQTVQTYQLSNLAFLENLNCFISTFNTRFKNFNELEANLGSSVSFDLPPRFVTTSSLVATFQGATQRVATLTANQAANVSYAFSAEQFIFNVHDYMEIFGKGAMMELAAQVESNVANNCQTAPFRFYGDGVTQINTYQQLASSLAFFRNFGMPPENTKAYLPDVAIPGIINSGLQQFVTKRNEEDAMSWELGDFSRCEWFQSNLLPIHTAGTEGVQATTLTVVSTTTNAAGQITAITFSGTHAANDTSSVLQYDSFQFLDNVAGQPNVRFLTFVGHQASANPVQFQATAGATSTAGSQVTVQITPFLQSASGQNQNITQPIVAGMQVKALPSHRCGMIVGGDAAFLAMPRLPEEVPFPTSSMTDPDTGVSIRMYHGSLFGQDVRGNVHDCIWGSTVIPEYSMKLVFPL